MWGTPNASRCKPIAAHDSVELAAPESPGEGWNVNCDCDSMSVGVETRTEIGRPLAGKPEMRVGDLGGFPQALR